ncbi:MAG: NAD-dependent epimerase/dehydratase family protein [Verrucomicrobiales bacterium]|nr:NAD-dependent epimerase/dehydratase family protein [Verrucomicrobiales bacterium]
MRTSFNNPATNEGSRVLLTGAAGFIGSHTAEQLVFAGHEVIGLDNLSTGHLSNLDNLSDQNSFDLIEGDVLDSKLVDSICKSFKPDAIIHLAGLVSVVVAQENTEKNFQLNLQATQIIAENARKNQIKRIVFASSASVYGDIAEDLIHENCPTRPIGMYGAAKLASENLLTGYATSYGMETVCLRYFNVYGDRQDPKSPYSGVISIFSDRFSSGKPVTIFGDGEQTRDFISVRDVARANRLAATTTRVKSGSINVCTGSCLSINELVSIFQAIYPGGQDPSYAESRAGEILHSCGNGGYAAMTLGFKPFVSIDDGLADLVAVQDLEEALRFDEMLLANS